MNRTILVVAAHTDDEALGCGGTIARHVADGDRVHAVFLADGVSSRFGELKSAMENRQAAAEKAGEILGIATSTFLGLPDNRLDSLALLDVVQPLEARLSNLQPEVIYTHHHGDLNVDHRIAHQAVITACRPQNGGSVREILCFEVVSSTEWATPQADPFLPNLYVDITAQLDIKIKALEAYALEMRSSPHSRSLEHLVALARHRGYCVGFEAAEAFELVRGIR